MDSPLRQRLFLGLYLRTTGVLFYANRIVHYLLVLCLDWILLSFYGALRSGLDEGFCDRLVRIFLYRGLSRLLFFLALLCSNASGSESASRGRLHAGEAKTSGSPHWILGLLFAHRCFPGCLWNSARQKFVVLF